MSAHLQVREAATTPPSLEAVKRAAAAIPRAEQPVAVRYLNTAKQSGPFGVIGHTVIVVDWADGKSLLIDAGMDRAEAEAFGAAMEILGSGPTETFGPVEKQMGSALEAVQGMLFTHLHSDHTLGVTDICAGIVESGGSATVYQTVQKASVASKFAVQARLADIYTQYVVINTASRLPR